MRIAKRQLALVVFVKLLTRQITVFNATIIQVKFRLVLQILPEIA